MSLTRYLRFNSDVSEARGQSQKEEEGTEGTVGYRKIMHKQVGILGEILIQHIESCR